MRYGREGARVSGYDPRLLEHLLPAVWDSETAYGIRNPMAPDAGSTDHLSA